MQTLANVAPTLLSAAVSLIRRIYPTRQMSKHLTSCSKSRGPVAVHDSGNSLPSLDSPSELGFADFDGSIKLLRLPGVRFASFRFLHSAIPCLSTIISSRRSTRTLSTTWSCSPGSPSGSVSWKQRDLPGSRKFSMLMRRALKTPVRSSAQTISGFGCCPRPT